MSSVSCCWFPRSSPPESSASKALQVKIAQVDWTNPSLPKYSYPLKADDRLRNREQALFDTVRTQTRKHIYPVFDKYLTEWQKFDISRKSTFISEVEYQVVGEALTHKMWKEHDLFNLYSKRLICRLLKELSDLNALVDCLEGVSTLQQQLPVLLLPVLKTSLHINYLLLMDAPFHYLYSGAVQCCNPHTPNEPQLLSVRNMLLYWMPNTRSVDYMPFQDPKDQKWAQQERLKLYRSFIEKTDQYFDTIQKIRNGEITACRTKIQPYISRIQELIPLIDAQLYVLVAFVFIKLQLDYRLCFRVNYRPKIETRIYYSPASYWRMLIQDAIVEQDKRVPKHPQTDNEKAIVSDHNIRWFEAECLVLSLMVYLQDVPELGLPSFLGITPSQTHGQ